MCSTMLSGADLLTQCLHIVASVLHQHIPYAIRLFLLFILSYLFMSALVIIYSYSLL